MSETKPAIADFHNRIIALADRIKQPTELMGSVWGKTEIEVMVWETLQACKINLKEHGIAFSYDDVNHESSLCENVSSLKEMVKLKLVKKGKYCGRKTLIPTEHLLNEVDAHLGR